MNETPKSELYEKFRDAVVNMANDYENVTQAYKKAQIYNEEYTDKVQRKFLKQYGKLVDCSLTPIDEKRGSSITMTGIMFSHDGKSDAIDFSDPGYAEFKKFFDKGYNHMMMYPRSWNETTRCIKISEDETGAYTISSSGNNHSRDPLSEEATSLTMQVINSLHSKTPDAPITVESGYYVDIQKDKDGNNVFTAYEPGRYYNYEHELLRAGKDTKPESMFKVRTRTIEFQKTKYKSKMIERTETIDLSEYVGENTDNPEITDIHKDAVDRKNGLRTMSERQSMIDNRKGDKTLMREDFFSMLTEYGKFASSGEQGSKIIYNYGYEPNAGKQEMLKYLSLIGNSVKSMEPYEIYNACTANKVRITGPESIADATGPLMKIKIQSKNDDSHPVNIYPVYDRTGETNYSKTPLAIAGIDSKTWEPVGVLRLDDPEVIPVYNQVLESVAGKMGLRPARANNPRIIPDSEKPDFMLHENDPQDDTQYE